MTSQVTDKVSRLLLIRTNERGIVAYFFLLYLFVGIGLAIGRSTADALFFKRYGIEYLPVIYLVLSIVLMLVSTLYAAFSDRLSPEKMFRIIYTGIGLVLVGNWLFITVTDNNLAYPVYFLVYEAASELLLVHASLYLGKNLEVQQLKRISSVIFAGAQIGIIIGGIFLALMSDIIGVPNMLLAWVAVITTSSLMIIAYHHKRGPSLFYRSPVKAKRVIAQAIKEIRQGLVFAKRSPLLRTICYAMFFMVIAYFTLSYSVNRIYNETFTTEESLSAFFGILNAACSFAALVIQLFITNRLLGQFGLKVANMIYPITTLLSFGLLLISYSLPSALFGSFNKDTLTPAIRTPVRNVFFNALPDYMQGRGRALAVALVMPLALVVTGCLLLVSQRIEQPGLFLFIGMGAALGYFFSHLRMNRTYINSIISVLTEKLYLPDRHFNADLVRKDRRLIAELDKGLLHPDTDIANSYARLMVQFQVGSISEKILQRSMVEPDDAAAIKLMKLLRYTDISEIEQQLVTQFEQSSGLKRQTLLSILLSHGVESVSQQGLEGLNSDVPTAKVSGIIAAMHFGNAEQQRIAMEKWRELLASNIELEISAGLVCCKILGHVPNGSLHEVLAHNSHELRLRALNIISNHLDNPEIELADRVLALTRDPVAGIRAQAYSCLAQHWLDSAQEIAERALEDEHPEVRQSGIDVLFDQSEEGLAVLKAWVIGNAGSPRAQRTALESLARRSTEPAMWQSIARTRIEDARRFSHALQIVRDADENISSKLMAHVLQERLEQTIELSLIAMAQFESRDAIEIVRACLAGADQQHIAHASEILRNLTADELASELAEVLESAYSKTRVESRDCIFTALSDVIAWCRTRSDQWLSDCANYAAKHSEVSV